MLCLSMFQQSLDRIGSMGDSLMDIMTIKAHQLPRPQVKNVVFDIPCDKMTYQGRRDPRVEEASVYSKT